MNDIHDAISTSLEYMNWVSRDARLLIYFSGSATTANSNTTVTCLLNQSEKVNIAEVIQEIEDKEKEKIG